MPRRICAFSGTGVKLIVAACGTASSVIDSALTDRLPMPYTGVIEPTARAAAAATRNKTVGIIGTDAAIRSGSLSGRCRPSTRISTRWVRAVPCWCRWWKTATSTLTTRSPGWCWRTISADPGIGADTLILGCTHFPLLALIIGDLLGDGVTLIDSGAATAGYIRDLLRQTGLENPRAEGGIQRYFISEHTETFARTARLFLGMDITAEFALAELPLETEATL